MADMDRVGQLLCSGCTVVLDALDTFDSTMEIVCRALQWWSREIVQVNSYLTTADAAGFSLHWDDHDVIVVQIAGDKSWEVRGASRAAPMYRDAVKNDSASETIVWAGTMHAGDVLHIPRGYWHRATRTGRGVGYSLHVTFGFVKRTGVDWLSWVADRGREWERLRRDLDRAATGRAATNQRRALEGSISELLATYPVDAYLVAREQERPPARYVATGGAFGPPMGVLCVTEFPPIVEDLGATIEVRAAGKKITFAERAGRAVNILLSGYPVELARLPDAIRADATQIAHVLIREGLCAELTMELSSGCTGLLPPGS